MQISLVLNVTFDFSWPYKHSVQMGDLEEKAYILN